MLIDLLNNIDNVYLAYGVTDFRKQTSSLCNIVVNSFDKDPYDKSAYIFCNKKRNSIKVLYYDNNGFLLLQKTLNDINKMKFKWPMNSNELKSINKLQLNWLLCGLKIEQKGAFNDTTSENMEVVF